jgi:hypothetical protein
MLHTSAYSINDGRNRLSSREIKFLSLPEGLVAMRSSMNPIKVLVQRFVSLPPAVRMTVTKRLLELYSAEQAARGSEASHEASGPAARKSFLEQFWDEVEEAHGDDQNMTNPFKNEGGARGLGIEDAPELRGFFPWPKQTSNLIALL